MLNRKGKSEYAIKRAEQHRKLLPNNATDYKLLNIQHITSNASLYLLCGAKFFFFFFEKLTTTKLVNFPIFTEIKASLLCSQEPQTGFYHEQMNQVHILQS
jgi:hypothetical protein